MKNRSLLFSILTLTGACMERDLEVLVVSRIAKE